MKTLQRTILQGEGGLGEAEGEIVTVRPTF